MNFVESYCEFPAALRRPMWRIWHNLLIRFDKDSSVNFMNYGYAGLNGDKIISLEKKAGTKGTKRYESFRNGKFEYWSFVLVKN